MTFSDACAYIAALEGRGWRMGLDRMREFLRRAGLSDALGNGRTKFIHVAGTNGKGATTAALQALFAAQGFRCGAYFSPFVYDVCERIQVDGEPISESTFASLVETLAPIADGFDTDPLGQITEFEFKTAMGFLAWNQADVKWVALEVGMGGRLDATNVVHPACSVIVSIGLDHVAFLGDTLAQIATEKAGIIKPGVPVVVGQMAPEAFAAIEAVSHQIGAPLELPDPECEAWANALLEKAPFWRSNAALALQATRAVGQTLFQSAFVNAIDGLTLPGRCEWRTVEGVDILLDGAHNAEAARALRDWLIRTQPDRRWTLLTGMLDGHEPLPFYQAFEGLIDRAIVAPIGFHRAIPAPKLAATLAERFADVAPAATVDEALQMALASARAQGTSVLVTGSFYLVGAVGAAIERLAQK